MADSSIIIIGAGNLATSLGVALKQAGNVPLAVWSRTVESASLLGNRLGCFYSNDISQLPDAGIVIISVADAALPEIAAEVAGRYPHSLVLHTAGSISMEMLQSVGCSRYGVFYPMQTFSKARCVDFTTVSTFVEGCNSEVTELIRAIAAKIGSRCYDATSKQRRYLHLAAVFACNFSNAMYAMSAQILQKEGLPFEAMLPLIEETANKVHHLAPNEAQTGPAARGDKSVMDAHLAMLDGDLKSMYKYVSKYIINNKKK